MISVNEATLQELEDWWDGQIMVEPDDASNIGYKKIFVDENKNGTRKTFFVRDNDVYVGQATLILKGNGKAIVNKLEIIPEYRGKGIATQINNHLTDYAKNNGIHTLSIGVEPCEIRNMQIYFHWGFTNYVGCEQEELLPTKKGEKGRMMTVLWYSKTI